VNSGIARIVVVSALIIGGVLVLLNGFTGSGGATAAPIGDPAGSPSPLTTTQGRVLPSPAATGDTTIAVFNGAEPPALGATVLDDVLQPAGYRAPALAANAPSKPVTDTVVYYVGGADAAQNKSNAARMRDTYFHHAKVQELDPVYEGLIDRGVQVVVVVGDDYPTA
jgi:hypothetical protein